jgi:uncharacterized protein
MSSVVYYGSPRQARLEAKETLPAKLDLILEKLNLRERVKGETVCLKLHVGNGIGYTTAHPVFIRKVVQAIKEGGGKPFIADVDWDVEGCESRGYTPEVLGCPIYPAAGPEEKYVYAHVHQFKNIDKWQVAGLVQDASFLVNFAHAKGHPTCSYGGGIKNLALGCMAGPTRGAMHDTMQFDPYWFPELCPDAETREKIKAVCPQEALVDDKERPGYLHMHPEPCNGCGRCLKVAPPGSLKIAAVNFEAFMEACAISTSITMSTFAPGKATHLVLATLMTPLCDCFGFSNMPILPDAGIFGSDDLVALEQAVLDATSRTPLIEENLPLALEVVTRQGHPLSWFHGPLKDPYLVTAFAEKYGLGSREYTLEEVLPVEKIERAGMEYIPA